MKGAQLPLFGLEDDSATPPVEQASRLCLGVRPGRWIRLAGGEPAWSCDVHILDTRGGLTRLALRFAGGPTIEQTLPQCREDRGEEPLGLLIEQGAVRVEIASLADRLRGVRLRFVAPPSVVILRDARVAAAEGRPAAP